MLELAGREALRVHVGEFLELERAFERDRVPDVPAEEQHAGLVGERPRHARTGPISSSTCSIAFGMSRICSNTAPISLGNMLPLAWARYSATR